MFQEFEINIKDYFNWAGGTRYWQFVAVRNHIRQFTWSIVSSRDDRILDEIWNNTSDIIRLKPLNAIGEYINEYLEVINV